MLCQVAAAYAVELEPPLKRPRRPFSGAATCLFATGAFMAFCSSYNYNLKSRSIVVASQVTSQELHPPKYTEQERQPVNSIKIPCWARVPGQSRFKRLRTFELVS